MILLMNYSKIFVSENKNICIIIFEYLYIINVIKTIIECSNYNATKF